MNESDYSSLVPRHIAIVMDGNGRWAKKRFLPRSAGHHAGVNAVRSVIANCANHGVEALTIFAFSSENWNRPKKEIDSLMALFFSTINSEMNKLNEQNICVKFIGDRSAFTDKLQLIINETEKLTADNTGLTLTIAANYGGRWDIVEACKNISQKVSSGEISVDEIDENLMSSELCLSGLPDIDLFIRSGGESRVSNFLMWQLAYTELYFVDTLWPDFNEVSLEKAISWFSKRQRRFGRTPDQVKDIKTVVK